MGGRFSADRGDSTEGQSGNSLPRRDLLAGGAAIGAAAFLGSWVAGAKAEPVSKYGAVGNGVVDDTAAINEALKSARVVSLEPSAGGYKIEGTLEIPSDTILVGCGYPGRLIRGGTYAYNTAKQLLKGSKYASSENNSRIGIFDVWFEGGGPLEAYKTIQELKTICVAIGSAAGGALGRNVMIRGCNFDNWPGPAIHLLNQHDFVVEGNRLFQTQRGGVIVWYDSRHGVISGNVLRDGSDDCVALNSDANSGVPANPPRDIVIVGNQLSEKLIAGQLGNKPICLRGARDVAVVGNMIRGGEAGTGAIAMEESTTSGTFHNERILIEGNKITGPSGSGIIVNVPQADQISIVDNTIDNCGSSGVRVFLSKESSLLTGLDIVGNRIADVGLTDATFKSGVTLQFTAGSKIEGLRISENFIERPVGSGISFLTNASAKFVTLDHNTVQDANQGLGANVAAISLQGLDRFTARGNSIFEKPPGTQRCKWGFWVATSTNGLITRTFAYSADFSSTEAVSFAKAELLVENGGSITSSQHKTDGTTREPSPGTLVSGSKTRWANIPTTSTQQGTDTAAVAGRFFITDLYVPVSCSLSGIAWLVGSVGGTDKVLVALWGADGSLLATSSLAGVTVGAAGSVQSLTFTTPKSLSGPTMVAVGIQLSGSTAKLRTAPFPAVCSAVVEGSFGTVEPLASFPSGFSAGQAPIITTY
jgi:hypothetical protein